MIIYTSRCLACTDRGLWKRLKKYAADNNLRIEERRVSKKREWQKEAEQYETALPFAVYREKATALDDLLEGTS